MANRIESIWDALRNSMNPEEEQVDPISNSYSQGQGYNYPVPNEWGDSYQTFSNVDTSPMIPVTDKQVVQQPVPQQMSNNITTPFDMASIPHNTTGEEHVAPVEEPGFMSKMGDGISDFWNDEEKMANLAIGLNSMRLNPDANLAKAMQTKIDGLQKKKTTNQTLEFLKINRPEIAKLVEAGIPLKDAISMIDEKGKDGDELRKQFLNLPTTKAFASQATSYGRLIDSASDPSPAGDLALVFNFMKILDPGSTVREGEFATASNAGGVDDKMKSMYNSVIEGTILSEDQRADFLNRAGKLYKGAENLYNKTSSYYEGLSGKTQAEFAPDLRYTSPNKKETLPEKARRILKQQGI
jgi:hypothetical protein